MFWKALADLVVVLHLCWILFIIFGALLGRRIQWVKWLHIGALIFSVGLQVFQWTCPLTWVEVWLRQQHAPGLGYTGDFLAHYAERLVYLQAPPDLVLGVTLVIIGFTTWAYWPQSSKA